MAFLPHTGRIARWDSGVWGRSECDDRTRCPSVGNGCKISEQCLGLSRSYAGRRCLLQGQVQSSRMRDQSTGIHRQDQREACLGQRLVLPRRVHGRRERDNSFAVVTIGEYAMAWLLARSSVATQADFKAPRSRSAAPGLCSWVSRMRRCVWGEDMTCSAHRRAVQDIREGTLAA